VDPSLFSDGPAPLTFEEDGTINASSGQVTIGGTGLANVDFSLEAQEDDSLVGVLRVGELRVNAGVTVTVKGTNPLVILVSGPVIIDGTIDVGAHGHQGGPGGGNGGKPGEPGHGACGGQVGPGTDDSVCGMLCISGSGGGGHSAPGGSGGAVDFTHETTNENVKLAPGLGGGRCGSDTVTPLAGGSGGAGGGYPIPITLDDATPGPGGGAGGAIQITATGTLSIGPGGGITAPGDGGGSSANAGGPGGGSGGAILLEAFTVTLTSTSFLAANGGGGGAGDCS
jgi:hypothetical protein